MIMFAMCLMLNYCLADPLLSGLYGVHGGNRVTVCVGQNRPCTGAVLKNLYVVTRSSCLGEKEDETLYVRKGNVNCSDIDEQNKPNVCVAQYSTGLDDITILRLDWPFYPEDVLSNQTAGDLSEKLKIYVEALNDYTTHVAVSTGKDSYYRNQYLKVTSSPIKMFLVTVVLPAVAFMVFFLFIIFFTGSNKTKGSYRPLLSTMEKEANI